MDFDNLVNLSQELEENLRTVEGELSCASNFIYQKLDQTGRSSEGVKLLEYLVEKWKVVCNELVVENTKEEQVVKELEEELEQYEHNYEELKKIQRETETDLAEKLKLEFNSSAASQANGTPLDMSSVSPFVNSLSQPRLMSSTPSDYDSEITN